MSLPRMLLKSGLVVAALLSGCRSSPEGGAQPVYGITPPPGDPTVKIVDFSYEPVSLVTVGSTLSFTVTLNKAVTHIWGGMGVLALIGDAGRPVPGEKDGVLTIGLRDDGGQYDEVAGDLIYSGRLEWLPDFGVADSLPVIAKLDWWDDTPEVIFTSEPLTVVEGE